MRETRNLLNLHWLFCLRISAKSWTTFCRDRIAPTCTIRHPVCPIAALQRRVRFSARLAGFCRDRCHQRRARRAERASFSAFVSNPDFRVPRLRQIGWRAADKAVRRRKRGHPRDQNRGRGYRGVAALARSGPGAARASFMSIFPQAWIQAFARERGIPFLDGVSLPRTGEPESPAATSPSKGHWCHLVRISEDLHDRLGSTLASSCPGARDRRQPRRRTRSCLGSGNSRSVEGGRSRARHLLDGRRICGAAWGAAPHRSDGRERGHRTARYGHRTW